MIGSRTRPAGFPLRIYGLQPELWTEKFRIYEVLRSSFKTRGQDLSQAKANVGDEFRYDYATNEEKEGPNVCT